MDRQRQLDSISCPLCGRQIANTYHVDAHIGGFRLSIGECRACDVAFQVSAPSMQESRDYMNWRYSSTDRLDDYITDIARKKKVCDGRLEWLKAFRKPNNRALDIGAGNGTFCSSAIEFGYQVCGTELSSEAARQAKELYELDLMFGDIVLVSKLQKFGLVTMWDVIEHLRDPVDMLKEVFTRTEMDGLLVILTGNYNSNYRLRLGSNWPFYLLDHQFYFTPKSLKNIVEQAGFSNFQIHRLPHSESVPTLNKVLQIILSKRSGLQRIRSYVIAELKGIGYSRNPSPLWALDELLVTARKSKM